MKHLLLALLLQLTFRGFSQPPCSSNSAAGNTCATGTPICELNGYCGNTSASYTSDDWENCAVYFFGLCISGNGLTEEFCGTIENDSYLSFVASSSTISFDVWVYDSYYLSTGDPLSDCGIQISIFSTNTCGSGPITQYYCDQHMPIAGPQSVSASGLTPGNTYYILIDGFAGDNCSYTFAANTGVAIPVDVSPVSSTICVGESVNLSASGGDGNYTWDASQDLNTTTGAAVTVTPPTTPGTYTYTVNSSGGNPLCLSSTSAVATVIVNPCGCSVATTNSGPVCAGTTSVDLFATAIAGATYSWTGPNGFTSSIQNPTGVPIPSVPGTYNFTVDVNDNGSICSSTTTVTVTSLPVVSAGGPISVCAGGSVTLSGSGAQNYTWNNGVTNGVAFVPASTTTYTVTGIDANGCMSTDQVIVTLNSLPNVDAGADQSVCAGGSVTLGGSGAQSYTWNNGITNGVAFVPSSTTTYTVTGTGANGCQNTDQITVTVNPAPAVNAGVDQTICQGGSVTLSGLGAQSYSWNNGVSNGAAFVPSATTTYTVIGTDVNGCQNTDQVTITVNSAPSVNAGADQTICQGGSVTLSGSGAQSYSWNNGVSNGVAFVPSATTTYTVTGVDANGCSSSDQVTITVNPLPNVNAGADQSVCVTDAISLSGSGAVSYTWDNGVTNGVSFIPGSTQTYTVIGVDANGCTDSDQVTVTVVQMPVADVSLDVDTGFPALTVNFANNSTNGSTYNWYFGDGTQLNANNTAGTQHIYNSPGNYSMVLVAANGSCADTDTLSVTVLPFPEPIVVIPNIFTPNGDKNNDQFFLNVSYVKSVKVQIVNRWGDKVYDYDDVQGYWDGMINGNPASEGVYFFTYNVEGINGSVLSGHGHLELLR